MNPEPIAYQHVTHHYVGAFVDELVRSGLRHVCLGPGSRSTPLALLCAQHPELRVWVHVDERSAAFFALGMARTLGQPVALVCTSGTAAANFLPAVVEACLTRVPLVVLTADRPHELRDVGAAQTIDQVRLYGSHVKWFVDMALPEATTPMLRYARAVASRAVALARDVPAGPVHVNFPLREPLVPLPGPRPAAADSAPAAWWGRPGGAPYTAVAAGPRALAEEEVGALAAELAAARRVVLVCGPDTPAGALGPIASLARRLGCPVLADPLSGLRTAPVAPETAVIDAYDVFLRDESAVAALAPDLIVRFGALPVSKPLLLYMERYAERRQWVVDPGAQWRDPILAASRMIYADPAALARALERALDGPAGRAQGSDGAADWLGLWRDLNRATRAGLRQAVEALDEPFEGRVFHELASLLPDGTLLYVGNSMPIRDMDAFFPAVSRRLRVMGNRGASGIDGVVSSALGAAAAAGGPVVLVLGDLSFYHDLNGLLAAKLHGLNATIIVINNDGGGIFSFLPQAAYPDHFEALFGTPTGLDFRPAVEMYGGRWVRPRDWAGFRAAVAEAVAGGGLHVIEVATDRARNVPLHRQVFAAALTAVGFRLAEAAGATGGPGETGAGRALRAGGAERGGSGA
ncbi:MAG: 2-succinyl-5-enolpyruvyl-6-hydroxy-3-cyclohexene-1-carboxylic-acid synthase, partial [Limnochordales bacterium]